MEWVERCWRRVRHRHLDCPLTLYHRHGGQLSRRWESWTPVEQLKRWVLGKSHALDTLAPRVWSCRHCGNQYLLPTRCCDRTALPHSLLFYQPALSPHGSDTVRFSLVMLTRNGLPLTRRAVASLLARLPASRRRDVEWIFVDGGSTDGTLEYVRELARLVPVKLILTHPAEPFNYSCACNRGARAAVGEYLLLLNNDIEVGGQAPWEALGAALADPRVGVVGASTVWSADQNDRVWASPEERYRLVDRPLTGPFWGTRREVFWELGGMDEAFTGYGYDELDFEYRAQLAHYFLALARVRVRHVGQGTFGRLYETERLQKLAEANRRVFEEKFGEPIYTLGSRVEPFASRGWVRESVVVVAGKSAPDLREALACVEAECGSRTLQVVVVETGRGRETTGVLEEYRAKLGRALTVVRVNEGVGRAKAAQIGRERAIGAQVRMESSGE